MIVESLELRDFRNYKKINVEWDKKINVIYGENAQGKTNIVEAIHYLSLTRSFRATSDEELIKYENDNSIIYAKIRKGEKVYKLKITISKNGKKVSCNNVSITRLSELNSLINVIVFEPSDVGMFKGSPRGRRHFMDVGISKNSIFYFENLSKYEKALKERNDLLKSEKIDLEYLEAITQVLIEKAYEIVRYRTNYINEINKKFAKLVQEITGEKIEVKIVYSPFVSPNEKFAENAKKIYKRNLESDLKKKTTSVGPHREDFYVSYNSKDVALYGSQGENRMAALALKLAPFLLVSDEENKPIIVLDDVMSELDANHQKRLIELIKGFGQVFITTTNLEINDVTKFEVKNQEIIRRNS